MHHSVEALTPVVLCKFDKKRLWSLFEHHSGLAFDITWLAANEKSILGDFLLSVGQRSAIERIAFLFLVLHQRARVAGLVAGRRVRFPFTQEHLADTIGFSLVHTNKSLGRLRRSGVFTWVGDEFTLNDEAALAELAGGPSSAETKRPFI